MGGCISSPVAPLLVGPVWVHRKDTLRNQIKRRSCIALLVGPDLWRETSRYCHSVTLAHFKQCCHGCVIERDNVDNQRLTIAGLGPDLGDHNGLSPLPIRRSGSPNTLPAINPSIITAPLGKWQSCHPSAARNTEHRKIFRAWATSSVPDTLSFECRALSGLTIYAKYRQPITC